MAKVAGVDILLSVDTDTTGTTPNLTVIGGQSNATLSRTTNIIDVTAKDAEGFTESIAGMNSWSIECDAFLVEDNASLDYLETAWNNRDEVKVQVAMPSGAKYNGSAFIGDFSLEAPADGAASNSISLTGNGPLTKTPATP